MTEDEEAEIIAEAQAIAKKKRSNLYNEDGVAFLSARESTSTGFLGARRGKLLLGARRGTIIYHEHGTPIHLLEAHQQN